MQLWWYHKIPTFPLPDNIYNIFRYFQAGEKLIHHHDQEWRREIWELRWNTGSMEHVAEDNAWPQQAECTAQWPIGKPPISKSDEFAEKFETIFDPQPCFGIVLQTFHGQIQTSTCNKFCNINDPTPPFETFPKIHEFWNAEVSFISAVQNLYI